MVTPGDCVHIQTGYSPDGEAFFHRFVVLTEPHEHTGAMILANFSTLRQRKGEDTTTVFRVGELPFLTKDSYVVYEQSILLATDELNVMVTNKEASIDAGCVDQHVVDTILSGIPTSKRAPIEVEERYHEHLDAQM